MRKERILLLGGNYFPEPTGIGKYNGEMMDWLAAQGYECGVVTTYPYYPYWQVQAPFVNNASWYTKEQRSVFDGVPITIYRCPHYVPAIPCGKKRILSDLSFFLSALLQVIVLLFQRKYNCVISVAPPFQIGLLGWLYKTITGAKFVYHIQDLQIDAASELGMIKSNFLLKTMFSLERFILSKADCVSSISEGMVRKIKAKYDREVIMFPNWADIKSFYPIAQKDDLKKAFQFSVTDKIVLYSGAIGEKQGLQDLLGSARKLSSYPHIIFVICGSGPYKEKLIKMAKSMELKNVCFMPLQPKEIFNQFLNMADLHLVLQKGKAKDLVMPSKLTTILSVGGLALVTAEPHTSLHSVVSSHDMGLLIEPENESVLTDSILSAIENAPTHLKENARNFAENYLTIDKLMSRFFMQVLSEEQTTTNLVKDVYVNEISNSAGRFAFAKRKKRDQAFL